MEFFNLRQVYVDELINQAKNDKRIVCLDSDSKEATLIDKFSKRFKNRSFSVGIAEQNMVSLAGGMSTIGLIPFVNSYGMFIAMRALDQVRNSVAYPNLNVKFVLSHHGLDSGQDGVTHQLTEDIAIFITIPNIKLLQPVDAIEMKQMVRFAVKTQGPIIIKSGKSKVPNLHKNNFIWKYGYPSLIANGEKVAIIAVGVMVSRAMKARNEIKQKFGFFPKVINLSSLTDVNSKSVLKIVGDVNFIVTLEDHSIYGGLGGIITEIFSQEKPCRIFRLGLERTFAECGHPDQLFKRYNLDENAVIRCVKKNLKL